MSESDDVSATPGEATPETGRYTARAGRWVLVLKFDGEEEFARGFEAGCLWEALNADPSPYEVMVGADNAEMVIRMAEATDRTFSAEPMGEGHLFVKFGERQDTDG